MSDIKEKIQAVLGHPQLAGLATVTEDGKPWVRYVMVITDDDMILRCATFVNSRKIQHIKQNREVHLTCGVTDPQQHAPYLQIQGRAHVTNQAVDRHGFWTDMLAPIFDGPDDPRYGVIEIIPYRIEYWSPGSYEPQVWQK